MNKDFMRCAYSSIEDLIKIPSKERGGFFTAEQQAKLDDIKRYFKSREWKRKFLNGEPSLINDSEYKRLLEWDKELGYPQRTTIEALGRNIGPELQFEPRYKYDIRKGVDDSVLK